MAAAAEALQERVGPWSDERVLSYVVVLLFSYPNLIFSVLFAE